MSAPWWKWCWLVGLCQAGVALLRHAPAVSINAFFTRCRRKRVAGLRRLRAEVVARPPASSGEPGNACTARRRKAPRISEFLPAHPHAAQRAVTGWRGGLGRVGADLASAGSMRPPPSPARTDSTAWLATTNVSREAARHHKRQPSNCNANQSSRHTTEAIVFTQCQHNEQTVQPPAHDSGD